MSFSSSPSRKRGNPTSLRSTSVSSLSPLKLVTRHLEKWLLGIFLIAMANVYTSSSITAGSSLLRGGDAEIQVFFHNPPTMVLPVPLDDGFNRKDGKVVIPTRRISKRHFSPFYGFLEMEFSSQEDERRQILDAVPHESFELTYDACEPDCKNRPLSCNQFHESALLTQMTYDNVKYIGRGHYRAAYLVNWTLPGDEPDDSFVFKKFRDIEHELTIRNMEFVRVEAGVMEELQSSPYIVGSHGYCHLSVFVEAMPRGDMKAKAAPLEKRRQQKLNDEFDVDPKNNYTVAEKVSIILDMSRAIRDLHAAEYVHDDLKLAQFLMGNDGHIKLNDFSRTMKLVWDEKKQAYKKWKNGGRHGDCRSPEEYNHKYLNERIDIFSLGSIFFSVLTGLIPFDEIEDGDEMMDLFVEGKLPFIDPRYSTRSPQEKGIVDIIKKCWQYKAEDRPTATEVADHMERVSLLGSR